MKTAIIIGATSGIGREVALRLLEKGWTVGIAGRRADALEEIRARFGGEKVKVAAMDVMVDGAAGTLKQLLEETGAPDMFLYASGVGWQNRELDGGKEIVMVRTNCEGMVRIVDGFLGYVRDHKDHYANTPAQVAVITSVAGTAGMGTAPAYSATKKMQSTYLSALAQWARMEKVPVRFSDIRPGFVRTGILNPDKHYPIVMTVESAAGYILRGLRRRRRIIIFDWRFRLIVLLWKLIPRPIWERITIVSN